MGDTKRFEILADWIEENYPAETHRRVQDVAGGGGCLALELADRGYIVEVIDPRKTLPPKKVRKAKRGLMGMVKRRREEYRSDMALDADLVVGLHPDGATREIALAADHCPVVIVPCCNYWPGHHGDVANAVRFLWMHLGVCIREHDLPMTGKNLLLRADR